MDDSPKCRSPHHHRAECMCARATGTKCEGCGTSRVAYTFIRLTNGGLMLCSQCLAEFNGKNPELAAVRSENEKLRAALKPFAEYARVLDENKHPDDMMVGYYFPPRLTVGDCRRAATVLQKGDL